MPRYYFDLREGDSLAVDQEGMELPDVHAALEEAARSLADMARELRDHPQNANWRGMAVEVRNDLGPLLQAKFTFPADRLKN